MEKAKQPGAASQNGMIDIVKFLCSLLIVTAHFITENAEDKVPSVINYFVSLYVIVVPFFFVRGGYFLFRKIFADREMGKKHIKAYVIKLLVMYLAWSVLYVLFNIAAWIRFGTTVQDVLLYICHALFYSTYKTIWFLPAMIIGVLITYFLEKKFGIKVTLAVACVFYLIGALGVSYSFLLRGTPAETLLNQYNCFFESTRNGLFNGFPFVALGAYIVAGNEKRKHSVGHLVLFNGIFTALFGILFVAEAFLIKNKFAAVNANTLLFLIPFSYFFVRLCLCIPLRTGKVTFWMRKISTVIFLCQRIFLTALPALLPDGFYAGILKGNWVIGLLLILISVLTLSELIMLLAKRIRFFQVFC